MTAYANYKLLTFHDAQSRFTDGNDRPRAYLERCLETIAQRKTGPVFDVSTRLLA
jgi:hypothetical protein